MSGSSPNSAVFIVTHLTRVITNILVHDPLKASELYVRSLGRDFHGGPTSGTSGDAGKTLVFVVKTY